MGRNAPSPCFFDGFDKKKYQVVPTEGNNFNPVSFADIQQVDSDFLFVGEGGILDPVSVGLSMSGG